MNSRLKQGDFGVLRKLLTTRSYVNTTCILIVVVIFIIIFCVYSTTKISANSVNGLKVDYREGNTTKSKPQFTYSEEYISKLTSKIRNLKCHLRWGVDKCANYERCFTFGNTTKQDNDTNTLNGNCITRLPQCIIIGSYKSGTRELVDFLSMHPRVVARRFPQYEVAYFDRNIDKGLDWYRRQMPPSLPDQVTIEKSPSYFLSKQTPRRIHEMNSSVRLILMVREPIERLVSQFTFEEFVSRQQYGGSIKNCLFDPWTKQINKNCLVLKHSLYAEYLKRYLNWFKSSQILILDSNDFKKRPYEVLGKVERFLNIEQVVEKGDFVFNEDKGFNCIRDNNDSDSAACYGSNRGRQLSSDVLQDNYRQKLKEFLKPHNVAFFNLTGQRYAWD